MTSQFTIWIRKRCYLRDFQKIAQSLTKIIVVWMSRGVTLRKCSPVLGTESTSEVPC